MGSARRTLPGGRAVRALENHHRYGRAACQRLDGDRALRRANDRRSLPQPGDTVVLDNLPAHKVSGIRERIVAAGGRLLYLPAYSPEFNPIERAFAKLKALLRAKAARTVPDLWNAIREAFRRFTSAECRSYLAAAGYAAYDPN